MNSLTNEDLLVIKAALESCQTEEEFNPSTCDETYYETFDEDKVKQALTIIQNELNP